MHAIGGIDLQRLARFVLNHFVDIGRAESRAGIAVLNHAPCRADVRLQDLQVYRLILVVRGGREVDGRHQERSLVDGRRQT
mgnify:CR=1 FL=1